MWTTLHDDEMGDIGILGMTLRRFATLILVLGIAAGAFAAPAPSISLDRNTDWQLTVGAAELTGGAGTDFPAIESAAVAQNIWVKKGAGNWRIDVSRGGEPTWDDRIVVYVRRTSDGDAGTVSGGTTYQEITTVDTSFFTGTGLPKFITLQFMTDGAFAAAGVAVGTYTTTVTYTITDNL